MQNLVKFRFYSSSIEANRDQQILAEKGVKSFIANEQTIQSDWLLSQALGGIQLQVFENELEKAEKILRDFSESYPLEVEHTLTNPEFDFTCPKCGSNHLYRDENPGGLFGISLLFFGLPLKAKNSLFHCYYCGNQFKN